MLQKAQFDKVAGQLRQVITAEVPGNRLLEIVLSESGFTTQEVEVRPRTLQPGIVGSSVQRLGELRYDLLQVFASGAFSDVRRDTSSNYAERCSPLLLKALVCAGQVHIALVRVRLKLNRLLQVGD